MESLSSRRIGYIDALKGFGIICVVLGHVADGYLKANTFPESADLLRWIFNGIYSFHMPLFFAVIGCVYRMAYFDEELRQVRPRVFRQIGNLLAVYVLFSVGFGAFKMICGRFTNSDVAAVDLLLIGVRAISPYWYLYVLILFYLLFSITGLSRANERIIFGCAVGACVLSMFVSSDAPFEFKKSLYYLVFFCGGYCKAGRKDSWPAAATFAAFFAAITLCVIFWEDERCIYRIPFVNAPAAAGILWMIWYGFEHIRVLEDSRLLRAAGGVKYGDIRSPLHLYRREQGAVPDAGNAQPVYLYPGEFFDKPLHPCCVFSPEPKTGYT